MKNGIEIRPNGVKIVKIQGNSIPQYFVEGSKNGPWDYLANARNDADAFGHVLFKDSDFTMDEIERGNILAINVVEKGYSICKICGRGESELIQLCGYPRKAADDIENKPNGNT